MKNQEKDLKNENTGSTRRKLTKEELTALCRRMEKHGQRFREYMRMVEEERQKIKKVSFDAMEYSAINSIYSGEPNPTSNDTAISISEMFEFVK